MPAEPAAPRRAAPLPPQERRAAILAATIPLLRERGAHVSTRELAEAAGVAEGTLFRVFPDKRALIQAALAEAMDPAPLERALGAIPRAQPLEERLVRIVEVVSARMDGIMQLMTALHGLADGSGAEQRPRARGGAHAEHEARDARVLTAIARVLEPDAGALRISPLQAAGLLRGAVLGDRMPGRLAGSCLPSADLATCLARGLLAVERERVT